MSGGTSFNEQWVQLVHGLVQRAPINGLTDALTGCRQLVAPAKIPDELVYRSCADFREKNVIAVLLPGGGIGTISEVGRAGSRAAKVIPYTDQRTEGQLIFVDQESGVVLKVADKQQSADLGAEMDRIDVEIAKPFKQALDAALDTYIAQRYTLAERSTTFGCEGVAGASVYSLSGKEVGDDIELRVILSSRRVRPHGYWAGNWTSQWRIVFVPEQKEPAVLGGVLELKTHYAEDCNVHFGRKTVKKLKIYETKDPQKWADEVVAAIKKTEDEFQRGTEDACTGLGSGGLKAMRRLLPLSKERFDWRPIRHSLVRDMKNAEVKPYVMTHENDQDVE